MEKLTTVLYGVISIVVIVLLIATVAIPVIEDSQYEEVKKEQNTSQRYYAQASSDLTTTIALADNVVTIGSQEITEVSGPALLISKEMIVQCFVNSGNTYFSITLNEDSVRIATIYSVVISIDHGVASFTDGDSVEHEVTLTGSVYIASKTGDYGIFSPNTSDFNIDKDKSICIAAGDVRVNSKGYTAILEGTIDDLKPYIVQYTTPDYTDISETATVNVENIDLSDDRHYYQYRHGTSSISVDCKNASDEDITLSLDGWVIAIVAPIEYTTTDTSSPIFMLLGIIPLMLIIVPVMLAVSMITTRRD